MARIKGKKRIVVKVGTSTLTHQTGKTNIARLAKLASVLSDLKNEGYEIVLVSSGAIAVGWSKLGLSEKPKTVQGLQASAAVGQCELMFLYDKLFSEYTVTVSQLLFSADTLRNIEELLNGDNDCLSAMVATLIDADLLIMLTDTHGLYDSNPSENDDAKLIGVVEEINDDIYSIAGGASEKGTGGFQTKIKAAQIATDDGIPVIIMNGEKPTDLYKVLSGESIGTYFKAKGDILTELRVWQTVVFRL